MSKKMMLLALSVVGAALFAFPAVAAAQLEEIDPGAGVTFTGTGPEGKLTAANEPTITCEQSHIEGSFASKTKGSISLDFTGCHISVFTFTVKCRTTGSALDNTIKTSGEFHTITTSTGKPGILVTAATTEINCGGTIVVVHGAVIGTITEPPCNVASTTATVSFTETNGTQDHELYTGTNYDLVATTSDGVSHTGALSAHATLHFSQAVTQTCQ